MASIGASRGTLIGVISGGGAVLGLAGGVLGIGLGVASAAVVVHATSNGSATQFPGFHVPVAAVLTIAGAAVIVGWLAAVTPAITASKIDVVRALRGAGIPASPRKQLPVLGLAVIILGIVMTLGGGIGIAAMKTPGRPYSPGNDLPSPIVLVLMCAGPVVAQVGILLCSGLVLRVVAQVLGRFGIGARLAARDTARNTGRSVPAAVAVMTIVFIAVFAMCLVSAEQANITNGYSYTSAVGQVSVTVPSSSSDGNSVIYPTSAAPFVEAVDRDLGAHRTSVLKGVLDPEQHTSTVAQAALVVPTSNLCPESQPETDWRCTESSYTATSYSYGGHLFVGDASTLRAMLGRAPSADAVAALASGGAVSLYRSFVDVNGQSTIAWWTPKQITNGDDMPFQDPNSASAKRAKPIRSVHIPTVVDLPAHPYPFGVVVSASTAKRIGLQTHPLMVLVTPSTPQTNAQLDALRSDIGAIQHDPNGSAVYLESGPIDAGALTAWIALGVCILIAIASAGTAIGLARIDGKADAITLTAVGARPRTRRSIAFWQGALVTGVGTLFGAALGMLPAFALSLADRSLAFSPPVLQILLVAVGLPLFIATCASILMRTRQPLSRRLQVG